MQETSVKKPNNLLLLVLLVWIFNSIFYYYLLYNVLGFFLTLLVATFNPLYREIHFFSIFTLKVINMNKPAPSLQLELGNEL